MGNHQTPQGPQPTSVVLFVYDLDESAAFYSGLLNLEVHAETETAVLLARADGLQLYLRATGSHGAHSVGGIGVQYVIWTAVDLDDLHRCEGLLKARNGHVSTWHAEGFSMVEGRDPSGCPVLLSFPGPDTAPRHDIMNRIYAW